jgi:hypothetical protein
MPERRTMQRARRAKAQGKAPTTQAGAFVQEEMEHAKKGKHPVKSRKQAVAIGLSKARRAGVKVPAKKAASRKKTTVAKRKPATRAKATRAKTPAKRGTARRAPSSARVSARTVRPRPKKATRRRPTARPR